MGVWSISIYLSLFCCVCENIRNIIRSPYQWYKCTSMIFFCAINAYMYMTLRSFMNCIHGHIQISYVDIYNTNNCACGYIWNLNSIYMHLCNFLVSRLLSFCPCKSFVCVHICNKKDLEIFLFSIWCDHLRHLSPIWRLKKD